MSALADRNTTPSSERSDAKPQDNPCWFLYFAVGGGAIGGLLYGYDTGIISGALLQIKKDFSIGHRMQEFVTSAILAGAIAGAFIGGWLTDRLGRKHTIQIVASVYAIGAIACSLAPDALLLCLGRVFLGLAVGASSQTVPAYVAELAPPERRGRFVASFNVAIGLGILAANLVASGLGAAWSWRWMIGGAAIPAACFLACALFMPESPRWLVSKGRIEDAKGELASVRNSGADIDAGLGEIKDVVDAESNSSDKGWPGLTEGWVRPAVFAALGVAAFTQLTGIEMMIYYAPTLLTGVGFSHETALRSSLWLGLVYAVMTTLGLMIVDKIGRRRLTLVMLPGAALSLIVLGCLFVAGWAQGTHAWVVVACLLSYMFFNAGGIQVVGWLLGSETYPLSVRGAGTSAQAVTVWSADLLVTITALTLVQALGTGGVMWVYGAMNILAFVFVFRFLPETAGKSLEQIENTLRAGKFKPSQ